jgi:hypothetical protein
MFVFVDTFGCSPSEIDPHDTLFLYHSYSFECISLAESISSSVSLITFILS